MKKPHILVTGANGYIGSHLVSYLLEKQYVVTALVHTNASQLPRNKNLQIIRGSITDIGTLKKGITTSTVCIHLAANKQDEPESFTTNVKGSFSLIQAAHHQNAKQIIVVSTLSTKIAVKGRYALTKKLADVLFSLSQTPVTTLKPSIVYGNIPSGVFKSLYKISSLPVIPLLGSGNQVVHPIHITDLVSNIERCIGEKSTYHKTFDVGSAQPISLKKFITQIRRICHKNPTIFFISLPINPIIFITSILIKFFPSFPFSLSNILGSTQNIPTQVTSFHSLLKIKNMNTELGLKNTTLFLEKHSEAMSLFTYVGWYCKPHYQVSNQDLNDYSIVISSSSLINRKLPQVLSKASFLLGPLDAITKLIYPNSIFQKKLQIIAALVETNTQSASLLLPKKHSLLGWFTQFFLIGFQFIFFLLIGLPLFVVLKKDV